MTTRPVAARVATAEAHPNIALVKYWGKRDAALNLPREGSLSLTLDGMRSVTTVEFRADLPCDELMLDGVFVQGPGLGKAARVLDRVRELATGPASAMHALVRSHNDFPTGAGLASSASGLAALATAAAAAAGLELDEAERSRLARRGSGSACRSILGGFVEWQRGERADGSDSHAVAIAPREHWDVVMLVAVVEAGPKRVSSTEGMRRTRESSPFYDAFLDTVPTDLSAARAAVRARDLAALGPVMERNCLRMHAAMLGADPHLLYLRPASLAVLDRVESLRAAGVPAYFTIDAGPNVKVLVEAANADPVRAALAEVEGVRRIIVARPGAGARVVGDVS